jgi:hypothetical protein
MKTSRTLFAAALALAAVVSAIACGGLPGGSQPAGTGTVAEGGAATPDAMAISEGTTDAQAGDSGVSDAQAAGPPVTSVFSVDTPNVVRRSNIVLGAANASSQQSMALGNGTLGIAVWAAGGLTAQINRTDTFPNRQAVAQLTLPGLSSLASASDFAGHVDLYDAMLEESGGGMTATVFVRADAQEIVIDVTGRTPGQRRQRTSRSGAAGRRPGARRTGSRPWPRRGATTRGSVRRGRRSVSSRP